MKNEELKQHLQDGLTAVKRLRDEIRVDLHLAGMDARDKWKELEPHLAHAEKLADDVSDVSKKAMEDMLKKFKDFKASLKRT